MPKPHPLLPATTLVPFEISETRALAHAIEQRDLLDAEQWLTCGAYTNLECLSFVPDMEDVEVEGLTATSLAALVDSARGELLFLPLILSRGGVIHQVDSQGRTLLHFAWHESVARYLLEHGAPVPEDLRGLLLKGLDLPPRSKLFGAKARPGYLDVDGDPVRAISALRGRDYPWFECVCRLVPDELVPGLVSPDLASAMAKLGYADAGTAQQGAAANLPPLVARFDSSTEIECALRDRDQARVQGLLKLGAMEGDRYFRVRRDVEDDVSFFGVDALGLAVLLDCGENEMLLTPLFENFADFHATHGTGGETLLHLATSPWNCTWLPARGLSPDEKNDEGESPEEMLSAASRAVVTQWRLAQLLPTASGESAGCKRL